MTLNKICENAPEYLIDVLPFDEIFESLMPEYELLEDKYKRAINNLLEHTCFTLDGSNHGTHFDTDIEGCTGCLMNVMYVILELICKSIANIYGYKYCIDIESEYKPRENEFDNPDYPFCKCINQECDLE